MPSSRLLVCAATALITTSTVGAFSFVVPTANVGPTLFGTRDTAAASRLFAGGFEWEDPQEAFDQGVSNPFAKEEDENKNEENNEKKVDENGMKVDPARLLGPRLQGCNLYFIGMMGSGKSVVGDIVAKRMGTYNFLDTDAVIEQCTGMTIPQIFEEEGEEEFRNVEAQVLDSVHAHVRCVISTGGGIVTRPKNWSKLQSGMVIWLDATPELIMERLSGSKNNNRPLLKTEDPLGTLRTLSVEREGKYAQADVRVEVTADLDPDATADLVVRQLHDFIDNNPPSWKQAKAKAQEEGLDWVQ